MDVHEVTEHANLCSQHHLGGSEPPPGLFPRSRTRFPSACEGVFHLRLRCCLCTAPAPPKDAGFSWEELLPGSVHAEKGAGPRGAASPRSGWEMISLCFYPFECSAERPGRELMQQLQLARSPWRRWMLRAGVLSGSWHLFPLGLPGMGLLCRHRAQGAGWCFSFWGINTKENSLLP